MRYELNVLIPPLEEFELANSAFRVVDPSSLPAQTLAAFDDYMVGSTVPHPIYVYSQDYARFCLLVRRGGIVIANSQI
ncbi:hypothetical protein AB6C61_24055 [Vibrio splendidus]|nr:hypothetical protein [Vibrio cyclitrophicus]PMG33339.1 hypothetical protein BCU92_05700 [Vibrio cyclitrophicus]